MLKRFEFEMTGTQPLLLHQDDVDAADLLTAWRKAAVNKKKSVPGDDRSPAWTWQAYLYQDGEHVCMPTLNLLAMLISAGLEIKPKAGRKQSVKEEVATGILFDCASFPLLAGPGKWSPVKVAAIEDVKDKPFDEQRAAVEDLGFRLHIKRARVGQSKHIRVRPCFDRWMVRGHVMVNTTGNIDASVLRELFEIAGSLRGVGDWRPSSKKPGPFGTFTTRIK